MTRNVYEDLARERKARKLAMTLIEVSWRAWIRQHPAVALPSQHVIETLAGFDDEAWRTLAEAAGAKLSAGGVSTETRIATAGILAEWQRKVFEIADKDAEHAALTGFIRPSRN